jgi:rubrerythrin
MIKAYWVQEVDAEWGMFLHAESANKAKYAFVQEYSGTEKPLWIELRAKRCNELLDIVPFTDFSLRLAGYPVPEGNSDHILDGHMDFCHCPICKAEKEKFEPLRIRTDLGMGGNEIELSLVPVVEKEE